MIFGKTDKQKSKETQEHLRWLDDGGFYSHFAWVPTKLDNGQYVWLQKYKTKPFTWVTNYSAHVDWHVVDKWV